MISSSATLFSFCFQSFPASGSFPMSQLFAPGGQSIETLASVLPMNIPGSFSLELTGLISVLSRGLSRVFFSTTKPVQFSSVPQSCPSVCDPMDCSMPGFPVHHQLLELTQTHVHLAGDAIQPSHSLSCLLFLPSIFPSNRVFSNESVLCIRWPKYWSFSFKR